MNTWPYSQLEARTANWYMQERMNWSGSIPSKKHGLGIKTIAVITVISCALAHSPAAIAADCFKFEMSSGDSGVRVGLLDKIWPGTRVNFSGIISNDALYTGYYDADRVFTVSRVQLGSNERCSVKLDSVFRGWDSHNNVALAFDSAGYLHVAGNMHASKLVYARASKPQSLEGLKLYPMTGVNEARVTYPTFVSGSGGAFFFLYRDGISGNGNWIVNQFVDGKWVRLQDALFGDRWSGKYVSAYPGNFVRGDDGNFHVAIVWRQSPDVATNFAVSYVSTRNFKDWYGHDGKVLRLPITPDSADLVDLTGNHAGLLNWPQITLDLAGKPTITYTKYAPDGNNAVYAARPAGAKWAVTMIASDKKRFVLDGTGSLPETPRFRNLRFDPAGAASIEVGFPGEPTKRLTLDSSNLKQIALPSAVPTRPDLAYRLSVPDDLQDPKESIVEIIAAGDSAAKIASSLHYVTQATNRDLPRVCTPPKIKACAPEGAPIYYVETAGSVSLASAVARILLAASWVHAVSLSSAKALIASEAQ